MIWLSQWLRHKCVPLQKRDGPVRIGPLMPLPDPCFDMDDSPSHGAASRRNHGRQTLIFLIFVHTFHHDLPYLQLRAWLTITQLQYPSLPWVRYITQSGDIAVRLPDVHST